MPPYIWIELKNEIEMEKIKNLGIAFFAAVGVILLLTQATSESNFIAPATHVWEMHIIESNGQAYSINKKTGEVRKYASQSAVDWDGQKYTVMTEHGK